VSCALVNFGRSLPPIREDTGSEGRGGYKRIGGKIGGITSRSRDMQLIDVSNH
jgi:hypothetical protein